jgi:hypothetical protein
MNQKEKLNISNEAGSKTERKVKLKARSEKIPSKFKLKEEEKKVNEGRIYRRTKRDE